MKTLPVVPLICELRKVSAKLQYYSGHYDDLSDHQEYEENEDYYTDLSRILELAYEANELAINYLHKIPKKGE